MVDPISRRLFIGKSGKGVLSAPLIAKVGGGDQGPGGGDGARNYSPKKLATERCATEWAYYSGKSYPDPFNEVELDVIFTGPQGVEHRVPAFWAGGNVWRVRYAPPVKGRYTYRTVASDESNTDLHGQTGTLEVAEYTGDNPLLRHGNVQVASDARHLRHSDGTPFFWLGDTWWMGLCQRLQWPADFQSLTSDRVRKGFTVIQIIAGLYPDMPPFDPRGANEAGYPWEKDFQRINPHYFDMADQRIRHLVDHGLVPCIVGCWGYFLPLMGIARMKQHWRHLVARWGAYPVIWCLAGEGNMPYYLSKNKAGDAAVQKRGWAEVGRYLRSIDPYRHAVTIHPVDSARNAVDDPSVLEIDMLQTGHSDRKSIPSTVNAVTGSLQRQPRMPVLVSEVCYEGILEASRQEVQRFMFWSSILSGACGHTYGANGIWQVNTEKQPYGPSPHGRSWGDTPWDVAYQLPGSQQLGVGKELLMRYPWWRLEPHPEWVEPHWSKEDYVLPYAAGISGELRIMFLPPAWDPPKIMRLESGIAYEAFYFNPSNGKQHMIGKVVPEAAGTWQAPVSPTFADWILVLEKKG